MVLVYKCDKCGEIFKTRAKWERHTIKVGIPCNFEIKMTKNGKLKLDRKGKNGVMVMNGYFGGVKSGEKKTATTDETPKNPNLSKNASKCIKFEEKEGNIDYDEYDGKIIEKKDGNKKQYQCGGCGKMYSYYFHIKRHIDEEKCKYGNDGNKNKKSVNKNVKKKSEKKPKYTFNVNFNNCNFSMVMNNTININNFGKENLEVLTDNILKRCIENPQRGLIDLIQHIHFNPDVMENSNVRLKSERGRLLEVFEEDEWRLRDTDITIHNLLTSKKDIMDDKFDIMVDNKVLSQVLVDNYEHFSGLLNNYLRDNMGIERVYRRPNIYNFLREEIMKLLRDDKQRLNFIKRMK